MGAVLAAISLCFERLWATLPPSPYFSSPAHCLLTLGIMAAGGLIAFSMVWAEFTLIANTSALTFMVAGTFKEIVTVGAAVVFLHERFTAVNAMGLLVLVAGVVLFNWQKYQKLRHGEIRVLPTDGQAARDKGGPAPSLPALQLTRQTSATSRPPSPLGGPTEASQRRVFVLDEAEDGVLGGGGPAVGRERSF
jgi:solute carrier family 35 protein C2